MTAKDKPRAQFELVSAEGGHTVQLVSAQGDVVMRSEAFADRVNAERAMAIVGEAAGRVMEPKKPGDR